MPKPKGLQGLEALNSKKDCFKGKVKYFKCLIENCKKVTFGGLKIWQKAKTLIKEFVVLPAIFKQVFAQSCNRMFKPKQIIKHLKIPLLVWKQEILAKSCLSWAKGQTLKKICAKFDLAHKNAEI